jgi:hypothetical protein
VPRCRRCEALPEADLRLLYGRDGIEPVETLRERCSEACRWRWHASYGGALAAIAGDNRCPDCDEPLGEPASPRDTVATHRGASEGNEE